MTEKANLAVVNKPWLALITIKIYTCNLPSNEFERGDIGRGLHFRVVLTKINWPNSNLPLGWSFKNSFWYGALHIWLALQCAIHLVAHSVLCAYLKWSSTASVKLKQMACHVWKRIKLRHDGVVLMVAWYVRKPHVLWTKTLFVLN